MFALDYENRTSNRTDAPLTYTKIRHPSQSIEEMVDITNVYLNFDGQSCWVAVPAVKGIFVYDRPVHYAFFTAMTPYAIRTERSHSLVTHFE